MTERETELARRAVAVKRWRWLPGMLTTCDLRVVDGGDDFIIGHRSGPTKSGGGWYDGEAAGMWPDLRDAATRGCVLELVREAHGCPEAHVFYATVSRLWVVRWGHVGRGEWTTDAMTEAEALVSALEAAPCS